MAQRWLVAIILIQTSLWCDAAVLVKNKMWPPRSTLNIVFIDGSENLKNQVKAIAPLWIKNTGLTFQFFDGLAQAPQKTHIRVSFNQHTGSTLGDHGDYYSSDPTLLLAELSQPDLAPESIKRFILHEFGHALGFEHEYRSPRWPFGDAPIQQQINNCQPRLQNLNYTTTQARVECEQINRQLAAKDVKTTTFDEFSIMNYPQVIQLANDEIKHIKAAYKLSLLDKLAVQQWYPKLTPRAVKEI